jgi:nucleoside-diphosphate-sugar epimerase
LKVLVTGGTGFIGSNLAADAKRRGAEVVVMGLVETDEERRNASWLRAMGVEIVPRSVTDKETCAGAIRGVTHVHHLAVAMREAAVEDAVFEEINLGGTRQLLEAAFAAGVERFVYCSTGGVFGHRAPGVTTEDSPPAPGNAYERSKVAAERQVLEFHRTTGLPVVILRPSDVYGPRDRRLLKMFRGVERGRFPLFGDGGGRRHMIHVDDVVSAFSLACEREEAVGQALILAGPEVCTLRELLDLIAATSGRPRFGFRLPLAPMSALAAVVEDACAVTGISPPVHRRRMDFFRGDWAFDTTRARRVLDWTPRVGLAEGIARTRDWYRRAGLL